MCEHSTNRIHLGVNINIHILCTWYIKVLNARGDDPSYNCGVTTPLPYTFAFVHMATHASNYQSVYLH